MRDKETLTILGLAPRQWLIKIIGLGIGLAIIIIVTKKTGFPIIFTKLFSIYVVACFLFYVLIDLPPMKPLSGGRAFAYALITFLGFSFLYSSVAALLPQFNPKFEIAKINKPPLDLGTAIGPEAIAAGMEIFEENKCFNCHKASGKGSSMRGPNFDLWQIGLTPRGELKQDIFHPRERFAMGFTDDKSKKAMPTYYSEEIAEAELQALLSFLQSLWSKDRMPMRGKEDGETPMVAWDKDPEMIAIGQKAFEGALYEDLNCAACHGKDGVPLMDGARDLRDPNSESKHHERKLKDWTDADWFHSVSVGVEDTPMMPWLEDYPPKALWLAIAYAKQFHLK